MKYLFFLIPVLIFFSGCVSDDQMKQTEARLYNLERYQNTDQEDMNRIKSKVDELLQSTSRSGENEKDLRVNYAEVSTQLDALKESIYRANGKIEESNHYTSRLIDELNAKIEALKADISVLDNRLKTLEDYVGFENKLPVESKPESKPDAQTAPPDSKPIAGGSEITENSLYNSAKESFDNGDYGKSLELFSEMLTKFPKSSQADNAQFWIGEIYYRQKWYEKAILEYQKVLEKFPKGNKAPAALLKQGFAFENLGDRTNAKLILNELIKKYPKSPERKIAQKKLDDMK